MMIAFLYNVSWGFVKKTPIVGASDSKHVNFHNYNPAQYEDAESENPHFKGFAARGPTANASAFNIDLTPSGVPNTYVRLRDVLH